MDQELQVEVDSSPNQALAAVSAMAEEWGAEWSAGGAGGALYLPVVAGLRRGLFSGRLEARATAGGTELTLTGETTHWRVHKPATAVLVLGALGALPVVLWPLSPDFLALAPVGLVLMFLAWFMIISRLRTAGADEFLDAVRHHLAGGRED